MEWTVRRATEEDIPYLSENLREVDKEEIFASCGKTPKQSLEEAFVQPHLGKWVWVYKGNPEIIFGLAHHPYDDDVGFPWMLCTDEPLKHVKTLLPMCKVWVEGFSRNKKTLMNFVYAKNHTHIRWLKWCGFEIGDLVEDYGFTKEAFYHFQMINKE